MLWENPGPQKGEIILDGMSKGSFIEKLTPDLEFSVGPPRQTISWGSSSLQSCAKPSPREFQRREPWKSSKL